MTRVLNGPMRPQAAPGAAQWGLLGRKLVRFEKARQRRFQALLRPRQQGRRGLSKGKATRRALDLLWGRGITRRPFAFWLACGACGREWGADKVPTCCKGCGSEDWW